MSDAQLGRIEQYLKRLVEAIERIEKRPAPPPPPTSKAFSDPKKPNHIGPYWGDSGWGSSDLPPTHER